MKLYLTILLIPLFLFLSCTQDEPTEPEPENKNIYTNGSGEIGSDGGEISVAENTSPIFNSKIVIPTGALSNTHEIKLSEAESDITFPGDSTAVVIKLEPKGLIFNKPVQVTLPVDPNSNMSNLIAYYINPDSQSITQIPLTNIDMTNKLASFETTHFSYFSIDDDGVHANVDMYYYNNKVSASVYVDGYYYGRNLGLAGIRTLPIAWVSGVFNAQEIVDKSQYFISGNSPSEILEVALYKKISYWKDKLIEKQRLWLVRTGTDVSNLGAALYLYENNNPILWYAVQNQNSDDRGIWFKGEPLIFHFSSSVEQSSDYYIKAKWTIGEGPCFNSVLCGRSTEVYEVTNYDYALTPNQMMSNNPDEDNNFVIDSYQVNDPPETPSNPNPPDNSTEVSISTTLSWECSDPDGDPLTYDIYFGTSSNPSLVKSNHSSKSYDPGSLNESTTYYWKIVAKDDQSNSATSSVWNFTTAQGNQPPTTPSNPNPVNNAIEVSTSTTLSWECSDPDGDPLTYDIYFGTSSNPYLVKSNHTIKSYDPGSLNESTTYYWKIVAKDDQSNSATSSIWKFTTAQGNQPPATPSNPNPVNNAIEVSTSTTLSWECSDPDGDPLTYDIYFGTSSNPPLVKNNHTSKSYDPGSLSENTTYYWEIVANDDQNNSATSNLWSFTTEEEVSMGEPCPGIPTVTYEGKTYNTVLIGDQCWLKENLDIGTMIESNSHGFLQTDNGVIEKYCYDNDPANCEKYGGLYEWPEAMQYSTTEGVQGICPDGWHIPSSSEFEVLKDYVGDEAKKLLAVGETDNATNETGFSALLAGFRDYYDGVFGSLGRYTTFWSSSEYNSNYAYYLSLTYSNSNVYLGNYYKKDGYSVRCVKD